MRQRLVRPLIIGYTACALLALLGFCLLPDLPQRAPAALGITGALLYAAFMGGLLGVCAWNVPERRWLMAAYAIGSAAEIVGMHTGWPFGPYSYTEVMVPQVLGWPPLIGLAWAEFAWYTRYLLPAQWPKWLRVPLGAVWMTAVDLVMDPVAAGPLHLWEWSDGGQFYGVPWSNFAGWLLVGAAIMLLEPQAAAGQGARRDTPDAATPDPAAALAPLVARAIGLSILVFFTVLALRHALWILAMLGMVLLAIHYLMFKSRIDKLKETS
jgi:uncharacterized membrane protein